MVEILGLCLVENSAGHLCCDLCVFMGMLNVSIDMYENLKNDKKKGKLNPSCRENDVYIKCQVVSIEGVDVVWLFWHRRVCCRSSFSSAR